MNGITSAISGGLGGAAAGGMTFGLPGAIGGGVLGGILGYMGAADQAKSQEERMEILRQAAAQFNNIQIPEEKARVYEELRSAGRLSPEFEAAISAPSTTMEQISVDPRLREAQMAALAQLSALGRSGMDQKDLAEIEAARQRYAAESQAQQNAIQESMARRGLGSSGMEQVLRAQAGQQAANQMALTEQSLQGEARRRALEAIMKSGQLGGQIRTQEFDEESAKKQAQDAINRFNASLMAGRESRNVDRSNQAQASNLTQAQRLADANVALRNTAYDTNAGAAQRRFDNEMRRTAGATGFTGAAADVKADEGKYKAQMWGNIGQGATQIAQAFANRPGPSTDTGYGYDAFGDTQYTEDQLKRMGR